MGRAGLFILSLLGVGAGVAVQPIAEGQRVHPVSVRLTERPGAPVMIPVIIYQEQDNETARVQDVDQSQLDPAEETSIYAANSSVCDWRLY